MHILVHKNKCHGNIKNASDGQNGEPPCLVVFERSGIHPSKQSMRTSKLETSATASKRTTQVSSKGTSLGMPSGHFLLSFFSFF